MVNIFSGYSLTEMVDIYGLLLVAPMSLEVAIWRYDTVIVERRREDL